MSIQELVAILAAEEMTATELEDMDSLMARANEEFEEEAQSSSITNEFLSRTYSL